MEGESEIFGVIVEHQFTDATLLKKLSRILKVVLILLVIATLIFILYEMPNTHFKVAVSNTDFSHSMTVITKYNFPTTKSSINQNFSTTEMSIPTTTKQKKWNPI